jgi:hypothetical protein
MSINVCHINITSIRKHKDELLARFSDYNIISVNETNLEKDSRLSLTGYNIFRNDRVGKTGGGVLLAIKEDIKCYEVYNTTIEKNEVLAVEIETKAYKSILIASIYVPPQAKLQLHIFHELYNMNNNCIIVGDLNAALRPLGSRKTNTKGRQLQELLNEGFLNGIDDDSTTFERNEYEEKIDWVLASQPLFAFISKFETHPPLGQMNGHKPITFETEIGTKRKPASQRISRNFKLANWQQYRSKLDEQLNAWDISRQIDSPLGIEEYTAFITDSVNAASQEAIPTTQQTDVNYAVSDVSKRLIAQKHQAYRRWKKNGEDMDKKHYYTVKVLLTNSLHNDRQNHLKSLMKSLCQKKMYAVSVWTTVRRFHNKRIKQTYPKTMEYNNISATTDREKANLFADFFEKEVYSRVPDTTSFHRQVPRQTLSVRNGTLPGPTNTEWKQITVAEVKFHIKQLKNSSTGPDNIHNRCLKNHTKLLLHHLTNLFNLTVEMGYIPNGWKKANIILLLKPKKDKKHPASYRPISLLSCMGKLLEKIIKQRLSAEIERRNILPQHQAGFRAKKSTIYNIVRLERHAREQLKQDRQSAVILFDIKAAFDSVWHDGLIYKLNNLRLPQYLIRYVIAFLSKRTASVELENTLSYPFQLKSGTPQGSPLSPLLYIIYTADSMNGIPDHTEHGLFADDTALWTSSNRTSQLNVRLQESTDVFQRWCNAWKLQLQPTKTEMIHFSPHPRKRYKHPVAIKIEQSTIKPQDSTRYLGVIIDRKLTWRNHLAHIEPKCAHRIHLLRFLSRTAQNPNRKIMLNIYKAIVRPILTYGFPLLLTASDKTWERLQIIQNKAIRAALNLPHYTSVAYIHRISNLPRIQPYAESLLKKAINTARYNHDHHLLTLLQEIQHDIT